ncbi:MAG: hypothetical protein ACREQI_05585 [Candidatus Binataceae bacterium]
MFWTIALCGSFRQVTIRHSQKFRGEAWRRRRAVLRRLPVRAIMRLLDNLAALIRVPRDFFSELP